MAKTDHRPAFPIAGVLLLVLGMLLRFDPRAILPDSMSWSGDFAYSTYGLRLAAYADILNIAILCGALLLIFSFTSLTDAT